MLTTRNPIILGDPKLHMFHLLLLLLMTGCPDCSLVSGLRMLKTYVRESLSAHELLGFPEFYKELEAEILGERAQLMGIQFIQLELRLEKNPSRSFMPVKSAEILWQFWTSSSFGVSLAHDGSWSKWEPPCGFAVNP
ncbi:hypothetical protein Tco_1103080 [Tanacetum coccineum]